jgi:hypothetical protein
MVREPIVPLPDVTAMEAIAVIDSCKQQFSKTYIEDNTKKEKVLEAFQDVLNILYFVQTLKDTGLPLSPDTLRKADIMLQTLSLDDKHAIKNVQEDPFSEFAGRVKEIYKPIIEYERPHIEKCIDSARQTFKNSKFSFEQIEPTITGVKVNFIYDKETLIDLAYAYEILQRQLTSLKYNIFNNNNLVNERLSPSDGPKSAYEIFLCCQVYLAYEMFLKFVQEQKIIPNYEPFSETCQKRLSAHVFIFSDTLMSEFSDIPRDKVHDLYLSNIVELDEVLESHFLDITRMIGLMRFFLHHHEGKVNIQMQAYRTTIVDKLMEDLMIEQTRQLNLTAFVKRPEVIAQESEFMKQWQSNYPKPSFNDVADEIILSIKKKKQGISSVHLIQEFQRARDLKPMDMEEVVVLYYPENASLRAMRQSFFKFSKVNGEDGPKISFLKNLANNYRDQLIEIGISEVEIDEMARSGKFPCLPSGEQYPLNIEHINDREYGGTNLHENLILMPRRINEQKNKLKTIQLSCLAYKDQGCWIINWAPKKDEYGRYPLIFPTCKI